MVLARWQSTIQDDAGNVIPNASVTVRTETPGSPLAVLYTDRDGEVSAGNPVYSDAEGFVSFHVAGGAYRITAESSGFSRVWRYVGIGLASERDFVDTFNPRGHWSPATTYAINDLVEFDGFGFVSNVNNNLGNSPPGTGSPIDVATSDSNWTYLGFVGASGQDGAPGSSDVTGTSTTSVAIGAATPTFTVVEDDRGWAVGARLRVSRTSDPTNSFMEGVVTAYTGNSLTLAVDLTVGSGTFTDWTINLAGQEGLQGETGTAATITIGTVTSIPAGSPSSAVRNVGTPTAAILDFDLERGEAGADGVAATITIGTVTTIPPGSPSSAVRNVGTPTDAILDFDLERGETGEAGADGVDPGYLYNFETSTSAPPSSGAIRFDNANLAAATQAFVSETTRGGASIAARLAELFVSGHSVLSSFILTDPVTEAQASFQVTSYTDSGSYATLGLSGHAGATSFSAGAISLQRELAGDDGTDGIGTVNGPAVGSPAIGVGELVIFSDPDGQHIDGSGRFFASDAEVQSAAEDRVLETSHLRTAAVAEALSDAATVAVDWTAAINFTLTIAGNRTIGNPTNGIPGTFRAIMVQGNDVTDRTITFDTNYEGEVPTITDCDNARWYLLTIYCHTPSHFVVSSKRAFG